MVENTSKSKEDGKNKVILPIFYDVKPDDMKLKITSYSNTILNLKQKMEDLKKKFSSEDVEMWWQALKGVDGNKGWELEKYSRFTCSMPELDEIMLVPAARRSSLANGSLRHHSFRCLQVSLGLSFTSFSLEIHGLARFLLALARFLNLKSSLTDLIDQAHNDHLMRQIDS
ncbi:hypothetical protein BT93_G1139 [Corymbia citriodora subsp. variegata]|nr:hypothetical protein BT93_G1139 [Corymbia citriodora subsp. variegata]